MVCNSQGSCPRLNPALQEIVQDHLSDRHERQRQVYEAVEELYGMPLSLLDTGWKSLHAWIDAATHCFETNHHSRC